MNLTGSLLKELKRVKRHSQMVLLFLAAVYIDLDHFGFAGSRIHDKGTKADIASAPGGNLITAE